MKTKVYKVVRDKGHELISAFMGVQTGMGRELLSREYRVGKTTLPAPGTKLFAFTDLADAAYYAHHINHGAVYEAEATEVESRGTFDFALSVSEVLSCFASGEGFNTTGPKTKSAVVCGTITLTKEVPRREWTQLLPSPVFD